ncbi:DNA-binding response regulator, OmpR family, contains REC and winged-helix (wHTH) domain [Luteibacter sp. UNCMF366Tsu5.1]|nr:DNA-binding response regulator, OmpR family, contains REC and winged-helix (wHTH) domain [Luteibacter sp. UNCMF366Tsu5.1]
MARVALVEDDDDLRKEILGPGLACYGFEVTTCATAEEFHFKRASQAFDLLVVDINLPDDSGLRIIQGLRGEGSQAGIIALSAMPIESAGLSAYQLGTDLYLMKPVTVGLLASALHAVLRRSWTPRAASAGPAAMAAPATDGWYVSGPMGEVLALTQAERIVVQRLRQGQGNPVDRELLIESLTTDVEDFDPHRIEVLIHRLRRKLTRSERPHLEIVTVRGAGYVLVES